MAAPRLQTLERKQQRRTQRKAKRKQQIPLRKQERKQQESMAFLHPMQVKVNLMLRALL